MEFLLRQGGGPEETQSPEKVAGGKDGIAELEPKEFKGEEGHAAPGVEEHLALG
jgi:hypothetical protein